jgi:DNA-binding NarL/FixJ family response regulator
VLRGSASRGTAFLSRAIVPAGNEGNALKSLVLVEDEPDMRLLIRTMLLRDPRLELMGEASSADEALAMLGEKAPDLIVLDHSIEGSMMGLDAAPLFKATAPHCKILIFTAYDLSKEVAGEPAVDGFLRKDRIDKLLQTVQKLLDLDAA